MWVMKEVLQKSAAIAAYTAAYYAIGVLLWLMDQDTPYDDGDE